MDEKRREPSGLVNALWGDNISLGTLEAEARVRMQLVGLSVTLVIAAAVGVAVGLLDSAAWGVAAATIAALALGLTFRAAMQDYSPAQRREAPKPPDVDRR